MNYYRCLAGDYIYFLYRCLAGKLHPGLLYHCLAGDVFYRDILLANAIIQD
jgi:hypothetical protein